MRRRILLSSNTWGHEFINIGGVKWATMNIGAETETDYGLYFAWGDTAGYTSGQCGPNTTSYKKPFFTSDYKFNGGREGWDVNCFTKYNASDKKTVLDPSDDAARLHWGGDWRMPTSEEFVALGNAVNTAWITNYKNSGVNGLLCTDKADSSKKLFFPACGFCYYSIFDYGNSHAAYWSSSLYTSNRTRALRLDFDYTNFLYWAGNDNRYDGASIRPVLDL